MTRLIYKRVSTDQQSTARQDLVLEEAGNEDPVVFEEYPGTSSRLHPLQRPKFRALLDYARPGTPCTSSRCSARTRQLDGAPDAPAVPAQRKARREYDSSCSTSAG
ncbi:recombinase family protein [Streptomyces sp. NPDC004050]